MVLFRTTLSSDLPVSRHMDTIAAGSVLRSHGLYPSLAINRLYTLILGQQFPLIASLPLLLMSMGQFDHPFWFHARPIVTKIGAMSVSKQAYVRMEGDPHQC